MRNDAIWQSQQCWGRELTAADAKDLVILFNDPLCLEYIGDKGIRTEQQATTYISQQQHSHNQQGYAMWAISAGQNSFAGVAGLVKRPFLAFPDIGYALMPNYRGQGLAVRAATAITQLASAQLGIPKLLGLCQYNHRASIAVLRACGMRLQAELDVPSFGIKDCVIYASHGKICAES